VAFAGPGVSVRQQGTRLRAVGWAGGDGGDSGHAGRKNEDLVGFHDADLFSSRRSRPRPDKAATRPDTRIARPMDIAFDERGLAPCVIQDWASGEVLTLAYMNAEALDRTRETGELHLYSRSRGELWRKGATSGNTQAVKALRYDCDLDAVLALVEPAGPACHTGERTCFYRGDLEPIAPHEVLPGLERTIASRAATPVPGSYTATLLADPALAGAKVQEEAEEVVRAAREESDERVAEEAADVLYHLAALVRARGLGLTAAYEVLRARRR
jgi:phosphoribosyl-AMP cyclohydrolase / phosphoribosyl-ATP pyrophosphohydrolase